MPTYEYQCGACETVSEINHRMSDPSPTECPVCGKPELSKLMSAAGFRLKGGGWYETDFKSDGKRNLAGDAAASDGPKSGGAESSSTKSESKSESKPAAAPAAAPASSGGASATTT